MTKGGVSLSSKCQRRQKKIYVVNGKSLIKLKLLKKYNCYYIIWKNENSPKNNNQSLKANKYFFIHRSLQIYTLRYI